MLAFTISLILFYHVNNLFGTRLPLEVFEIPQSQTQVYNSYNNNINNSNNNNYSSTNSYNYNNINNNNKSSNSSGSNNNHSLSNNFIKHKSIYNHNVGVSTIAATITSSSTSSTGKIGTVGAGAGIDRRRSSRQMLESIQQPQRILYQIGETEEDLPVCAPNAVCSKIDLYETPWIERQCRCPESVYNKSPFIINHHHHHHHSHSQQDKLLHPTTATTTYLDTEKQLVQQKRLADYHHHDSKKIDDLHFKKLMHKLEAVYKEDLMLDNNDFDNNDELNNAYHAHRSEFGNRKHGGVGNNNYRSSSLSTLKKSRDSSIKSRHHRKDISYIGGCPSSIGIEDGHTIADKTRHYKLCNPVHKLPLCNSFRDYTWTLTTSPEMNVTEQIVHCRCRPNSVTYLTKWEPIGPGRTGYTYLFACSPQSRLRCQRKEPCKLFTVRKRQEFLDEVNTNPLCQCPKGHRCPKHHTDSGVIAGKTFIEDSIQTYSGYCMAND